VVSSVKAMCESIQGVNCCIADLHVVNGTCVSAESSKLSGNMQSVDYGITELHVDEQNLCAECVNSTDEIMDTSVGHHSDMVPGSQGNSDLDK